MLFLNLSNPLPPVIQREGKIIKSHKPFRTGAARRGAKHQRLQFLVLGMKIKLTFIQPNVEHVVMNVAITQIALQQKNPAHMVVLLQTPAAYAQAAIQNHQYPAKNITPGKAEKPNPAAVQLHMSPTPMTLPANVLQFYSIAFEEL